MQIVEQESHCLNCGTDLKGSFCHYCGQAKIRHREGFIHTMIHFIGDFIHFDSLIFKTIVPLLFRPGYLVKEYEAGRRVSHLNPIKMYVFLSFLFFSILYFTKDEHSIDIGTKKAQDEVLYSSLDSLEIDTPLQGIENIQPDKNMNTFEKSLIEKIKTINEKYKKKELIELLSESFLHNLPKVLFILLPFFALFLKLLYIRRPYDYISHLIFSIQFFNFIFLFGGIALLCSFIPALSFISDNWYLFTLINLWVAMVKVYDQGWVKTGIKLMILNFLSMILAGFGAIFNAAYSLLNL